MFIGVDIDTGLICYRLQYCCDPGYIKVGTGIIFCAAKTKELYLCISMVKYVIPNIFQLSSYYYAG